MKNILLMIILIFLISSCEEINKTIISINISKNRERNMTVDTLSLPKGEVFYQLTPTTRTEDNRKLITLDTINKQYKVYEIKENYNFNGSTIESTKLELIRIIK